MPGPRTPRAQDRRPPSREDRAGGAQADAPEDAARKLKGYLRELDKREEEILAGLPDSGAKLAAEVGAAAQRAWKQLGSTAQDAAARRALEAAAANLADYEERLALADERLKAEGRMWELREQDLQEQFAYREEQMKRQLEQRIRALEAQVQGLGGQPQDGPGADHAVVDCPVSLGLSVAEERAQLTFTQEPVKLHPGVRVIGVDPSVADSSLEVGDIITKVSYTVPIGTSADFRRVVHRMCPGDLVMVHVAKEGGERVYPIIAGGCPPASGPDASV